jgi:hypothetical protein
MKVQCPNCGKPLMNLRSMGGHAHVCPITMEQLFWAKVDKSGGQGACWNWIASRKPRGYGQFHYQGKMNRAHRLAWILTNGEPGKLEVCHSCDNKLCCNPAHLWLGTHQDNMADCKAKDRHCRGDRGRAKLTEEQAREVLRLKGKANAGDLADKYGVGNGAIQAIWRGDAWMHIQEGA